MTPEIQAYVVLIIGAFNLVLAGIILAQDFRSRTNVAFALLSLAVACWGLTAGLYLLTTPEQATWFDFLPRAVYFTGTNTAAAFLYFALVFNAARSPNKIWTALLGLVASVSFYLHFFTNSIIAGPLALPGGLRGFLFGPLRFLIDIELWGLFGIALVVLMQTYRRVSQKERSQIILILIGTYTTLLVGGTTNDIFLTYSIFEYFWVGPAAVIMWMSAVAYSVARLQLFNIKVIAAEMLIILLWLILLLRTVLSSGQSDFLINAGLFLIVLVLGIFLIRSVIKEVEQREMIEKQGKELEQINTQQESLLHFISHEIKGYFAKSEAAFASIGEGDYGDVPESLKTMAAGGLKDVRLGTSMVMNILDASNMKKGNVTYKKSLFDLKKTVHEVAEELRPDAQEKGLTFVVEDNIPGVCVMLGDEVKIRRHVIRNIIDNAIRYTLAGGVTVTLSQTASAARLVIEDTGVGIVPEDRPRLFTEGGHGKESIKVNVHSTGYGLYIAKEVVEAHGGTIRALSEGAGKGSRFVIELPLSMPATTVE